jgi:hypothetical protein
MTAIEHKEIRGITLRNLIVTIVSTASIVAAVMTTYLQLKNDIHDLKSRQETTDRVNEIRLKLLEGQVSLLNDEIKDIHDNPVSTK